MKLIIMMTMMIDYCDDDVCSYGEICVDDDFRNDNDSDMIMIMMITSVMERFLMITLMLMIIILK